MNNSNIYFPPNAIRVCIDQKDSICISGRVYSPLSPSPFTFYDFQQLLLQTDALFDRCGYPQAFQTKRTFIEHTPSDSPTYCTHPKVYFTPEQLYDCKGNIATYNIFVISRSQANWQGYVSDGSGKRLGMFRDALEILNYIE